jgi:hypothetical protein
MAELVNQREAAEQLGLSVRTLERLRLTGGGPQYAKLCARVLYRQIDLDTWVAERLRGSTSEEAGR